MTDRGKFGYRAVGIYFPPDPSRQSMAKITLLTGRIPGEKEAVLYIARWIR